MADIEIVGGVWAFISIAFAIRFYRCGVAHDWKDWLVLIALCAVVPIVVLGAILAQALPPYREGHGG